MQLFQAMRLGALVLSSVLLAKTGLGVVAIGQYEALLYLGSTLSFFWTVGLLQGIAPKYVQLAASDKAEAATFLGQVFAVFCGFSLLMFILLVGAKPLLLPLLVGVGDLPHYTLFCLSLLFNLPSMPVEHFYLVQKKAWHIAIWGAVSAAGQLACFFGPLWLGWGLEGAFIGLGVLGGVKFIWAFRMVWAVAPWRFDRFLTRDYIRLSLPLMGNTLASSLVVWFDNWLVAWHYQNEATFAIFRYGSREFPLATALATALGVALTPHLAADPIAGMAELRKRGRRLMHFLFPITGVLLFLTRPLFPVVFNPDFAASAPLFNIYLLLTISRVLLPNTLVLAAGHPNVLFRTSLAELALKVALGFWFIHLGGLEGLAWSVVVCFFFEKLVLIWYLERKMDIRTHQWLDLRWYACYTIALVATWIVSNHLTFNI